jgi:hypothetical protein
MSNENKSNINLLIQSFFTNGGSSYVPINEKPDGFKPWSNTGSLETETERDVSFIESLTDMYELVGPKEWKGQTIPKLAPLDAEVGDDHIYLNDAPLLFIAELVTAKEIFGVQVSFKDTFISEKYGNYSESFILKPDNISELYGPNMAQREDAIVLDIVKVRTTVPVCSMRQKHSDTVSGKVDLLGKLSTYNTELCGYEVTIAQCLQQLCLGLNKEKKFPYLPAFLGGYGSPPIFRNAKSVVRSFYTYRNGSYYVLLAGICKAVYDTKTRGRLSAQQFLARVKGSAENWQNWYKVYTRYVPTIKGDLHPKLYDKKYFLGTLGRDELWDSAAYKLQSAGVVVTKTQLLVHDHLEDLTKILLSPFCSLETRELIEQEKRSQRQESVFNSNILKKMNYEVPQFLEECHIDSLLDLSKGGNYHLKSILSADEIFTRETLDMIKQSSPTRVNLQMVTRKGLRYPIQFDLSLKEEDVEFYKSLYEFVRGDILIDEVSRVLVEDDPFLLQIARNWAMEKSLKPLSTISIMVITTDDIELCKNINKLVPQVVVARISVKRDAESIQRIKDSLKSRYYHIAEIRYFDDEGSIDYFRSSTAKKFFPVMGWQTVKFILGRTINPYTTEQRRLNEVRIKNLVLQPDGIFDQQGIILNRYNRPIVSHKRSLKTFEDDFEYDFERDE